MIYYWSGLSEIPFDRAKRQMIAESNGDPHAISFSGAIGLFQLMPQTAKELGVNPYDCDDNCRGAMVYMRWKLQEVEKTLGSMVATEEDHYRFALAAYNCGFGYVKAALRLLREGGKPATWETFLPALVEARVGTKRADVKQVRGYIERILPPAPLA